MSGQRHTAQVAALAVLGAMATAVGARGPVEIADVAGNCPSQKLVEEQLDPLLPPLGPRLHPVRASVRDEGSRYTVEIGDARRTVDDPERRCLERARVAAVFIALNVPKPEPPASPSVSTAPSAAPLPPSPAPASETWLSVQAEAELAVASTKLVAPGAGLGIALHHVPWRFALDAGIVSSVELGDEQKGTASLSRVPIALTAAYLVRAGSFDVGPHAGLALDVLYARGRDVPGADAGTRANFGAELGILARWRAVDRLGLVATLGASLFPGRYELRIEPTGALAMTPRLWATSTIGIFWDFRDSEPPVP